MSFGGVALSSVSTEVQRTLDVLQAGEGAVLQAACRGVEVGEVLHDVLVDKADRRARDHVVELRPASRHPRPSAGAGRCSVPRASM